MHCKAFAAAIALLALATPALSSELKVGYSQDALTLDPANHRKRETETIIRNMCDGLLTRDGAMNVVPEVAESYKQIDAKTWEFKLRKNVKFHSGATLTAEDVKFTLDRLTKDNAMGGQTSPRKDLLGPIASVDVVDPQTVRIQLSSPWPILPAMLPFQEIVRKGFVDKVGGAALATREDCLGPFKLVEWRRGDSIIMERFDDYYGGSPAIPPVGKARVDRVIFRIIPENSSRVAALLAGEVDIINELPVSAIKQVEASGRAKVAKANGTRSFFVAMNLAKKPFDDPRVRKALNYAIDRKLIIDKVLNGTAVPLNGVLSPQAFGFNPDLSEYKYDPVRAKALLAEAGYANGLTLTIDTEGAFKDVTEAVASMLQRVGIKANVQVWEGAVLTPIWRDPAKRKDRDLYFTGWGNGSLDPSDIMPATLRTGGRGNSAGFSNAKVDQLLDAAETELDPAKRRAMYFEAQAIVNGAAPWIFLWLPQDLYGVASRVSGWAPSPDSRINLHRAALK